MGSLLSVACFAYNKGGIIRDEQPESNPSDGTRPGRYDPLGSAASTCSTNVEHDVLLTFCTEALNLNVVVVGVVMTAMRLFDGITDPIIGNIIDRTETRSASSAPSW